MRKHLIEAYKALILLRESESITGEEYQILSKASGVIMWEMTLEESEAAFSQLDPNY